MGLKSEPFLCLFVFVGDIRSGELVCLPSAPLRQLSRLKIKNARKIQRTAQ